eukprot:scaffold5495_cov376-Prasinococcus_capsulatus_cf.AAC.1
MYPANANAQANFRTAGQLAVPETREGPPEPAASRAAEDVVIAIIENRAKEVGVAALDLTTLHLTLNQFIESSREYHITKRCEYLMYGG